MAPLAAPLAFPLGASSSTALSVADFTRRMLELFPQGWANETAKSQPSSPNATTGIVWSLFNALAQGISYVDRQGVSELFDNLRLATADNDAPSSALSKFAADFFGSLLQVNPGESDDQFRLRIKANLFKAAATREAIRSILEAYTGANPRIVEPWQIADTCALGALAIVTQTGTPGTTQYTYSVFAIGPDSFKTTGSFIGVTATGNATLSVTNYNGISWQAVPGALYYVVYRTTGGTAQGIIGTPTATSLADTGLGVVPISSTIAANSSLGIWGNAPPSPALTYYGADTRESPFRWGNTLTPGATVTVFGVDGLQPGQVPTEYVWRVVALRGTEILQIFEGRVTTGNATLTGSNFCQISWPAVPTRTEYKVYRYIGGAAQGRIAQGLTGTLLNDTGLTATPETVPVPGGMPWQGLIDTTTPFHTVTAGQALYGYSPVTATPADPASNNGWFWSTDGTTPVAPGPPGTSAWFEVESFLSLTMQDVYNLINEIKVYGTTIWVRFLPAADLAGVEP